MAFPPWSSHVMAFPLWSSHVMAFPLWSSHVMALSPWSSHVMALSVSLLFWFCCYRNGACSWTMEKKTHKNHSACMDSILLSFVRVWPLSISVPNTILFQCWDNVSDVGPALKQHCANFCASLISGHSIRQILVTYDNLYTSDLMLQYTGRDESKSTVPRKRLTKSANLKRPAELIDAVAAKKNIYNNSI